MKKNSEDDKKKVILNRILSEITQIYIKSLLMWQQIFP